MKTYAVRTAGTTSNSDYSWKNPVGTDVAPHNLATLADQGTLSFGLAGHGAFHQVYCGGFQTALMDFRNRVVRVDLAVDGLTESEARTLVSRAMIDTEGFCQRICEHIHRESPSQWSVDFEGLAAIINELSAVGPLSPSEGSPKPFEKRVEGFFKSPVANPDMEEVPLIQASKKRLELAAKNLLQYELSPGDGLKLLICDFPSKEGYVRATEEADLLLWAGGPQPDKELPQKKPVAPPKGAGKPTTRSKSCGPPYSGPLKTLDRPYPNCQKKGRLLAGVFALVFVSTLIVIGLKKK